MRSRELSAILFYKQPVLLNYVSNGYANPIKFESQIMGN